INRSFVSDLAVDNTFPLTLATPSTTGTATKSLNYSVPNPLLSATNRPRNAVHDNSFATGFGADQNDFRPPSDNVNSCAAVDERFNLIFTLAVVFSGVTVFCTGYMMDRLGTRVCRSIGMYVYMSLFLVRSIYSTG
ncbi:hypothetical protein LSAT2_013814, partial [Lamellibrachia satsuma]